MGGPHFLTLLFPSHSGVIGSGLCVFSRFPILDTLLYQYSLNGYPYMVSGVGGHPAPRCLCPRSLTGPDLLPFPSGSSSTGTGSAASPSASSSLKSLGSSSTSTSPT